MEKRTGRHGRRKVNVPNLSGLTREQAQAALTSIGFQYSESSTDTSDSNNTNKISSQSVSAGSAVVFGSTIPFVYFNYVNPVVITYGPCQDYSTSSSYNCIGGTQNQDVTTTYRRRQILENGVWNGTYDECSASVSTGPAQYTDGRCGYVAPTITYGPCEAYGSGTNIGSGTQCSGTFTQEYTDYRYNTRKKIYSNGVWDGSSYTTSGCGTTDVRSVTSSSQVCNSCGYSCSVTTYGPCEAYGEGLYQTGSGTQCSGTSTQTYVDYAYYARRKIYVDGSWNGYSYDYSGCTTVDQRTVTGSSNVCDSCGYTCTTTWYCTESYPGGGVGNCGYSTATYNNSASGSGYSRSCSTSGYPSCGSTDPAPPASCTCNYTDMGSYHYAPECCPSGSVRAGSLGGYSSGSCCPNVNKTQKWQCKSYDVTNSASANYYTCYSVGQCAADYNSDGSRTVCYV